jgi:hypothetical protein
MGHLQSIHTHRDGPQKVPTINHNCINQEICRLRLTSLMDYHFLMGFVDPLSGCMFSKQIDSCSLASERQGIFESLNIPHIINVRVIIWWCLKNVPRRQYTFLKYGISMSWGWLVCFFGDVFFKKENILLSLFTVSFVLSRAIKSGGCVLCLLFGMQWSVSNLWNIIHLLRVFSSLKKIYCGPW